MEGILRSSLITHRMPTIQVDDYTGRLLQLLTALRRPERVIEIGTLFGYSTVYLARGLPPGARLTTLESDAEVAELARHNVEQAGLSDRVEVVVGPAAESLLTVRPGSVGLVFIDADKKAYVDYLKLCYPLLESGGLLIADDAFADGDYESEAAPDAEPDREVQAIRSYGQAVGRSPALFSAFIPTEAGLLISLKV